MQFIFKGREGGGYNALQESNEANSIKFFIIFLFYEVFMSINLYTYMYNAILIVICSQKGISPLTLWFPGNCWHSEETG